MTAVYVVGKRRRRKALEGVDDLKGEDFHWVVDGSASDKHKRSSRSEVMWMETIRRKRPCIGDDLQQSFIDLQPSLLQ